MILFDYNHSKLTLPRVVTLYARFFIIYVSFSCIQYALMRNNRFYLGLFFLLITHLEGALSWDFVILHSFRKINWLRLIPVALTEVAALWVESIVLETQCCIAGTFLFGEIKHGRWSKCECTIVDVSAGPCHNKAGGCPRACDKSVLQVLPRHHSESVPALVVDVHNWFVKVRLFVWIAYKGSISSDEPLQWGVPNLKEERRCFLVFVPSNG